MRLLSASSRLRTVVGGGLLAGISLGAAMAQDGFPLVCNGSGMSVSSDGGSTVVLFLAGTAAAGTTPPSPGQCAWLDRAFRPGEPTRLVLSGDPAGASAIADAVNAGGTFFVRAFNDNSGSMVVTHVGP